MSKGRVSVGRNTSSIQGHKRSNGSPERFGETIATPEAIPERKGHIGQQSPVIKRFVVEVQLFPNEPDEPWKPTSNQPTAYYATREEAEKFAEEQRAKAISQEMAYRVVDTQPFAEATSHMLYQAAYDEFRTGVGKLHDFKSMYVSNWESGKFWEREMRTSPRMRQSLIQTKPI